MFRFFPTAVVAAALASATAHADAINARTLCFSYQQDVKSVWVPTDREQTMTEVGLFTSGYSLPFKMMVNDGRAVFSRPSDDEETPYEALASAKLPDTSSVLFLFLPSGKEETPYRVVALPDDSRKFPYGSIHLMNLSKEKVRVHMGEHNGPKAVALAPGKAKLVDEVTRLDDFNRYPVLAEYLTDEGFARFHNTAWRSIEGKRDLVIVFNDPASGRPRIQHYEDARPASLEPEP